MSIVDSKTNLAAISAVMAEVRKNIADPFAIGRAVAGQPDLVLPRALIAAVLGCRD